MRVCSRHPHLELANTRRLLLLAHGSLLFVSSAALGCADRFEGGPSPRSAPMWVSAHELPRGDDTVGVSSTPPVRRAPPEFDDTDPESVRLFHDVLSPFGAWVDDPRLGLIWIPSRDAVGETFVPYGTHGRWTYRAVPTASYSRHEPSAFHEYVWVSNLPWGWVTFHYGRWAYTGERGWAWVAGRRYGAAWVDWRVPSGAPAVVGWGPTPPSHVWRASPRETRARLPTQLDPRAAALTAIPYAAFATPYTYVRTRDLFAPDVGARLLSASSAFAVAYGTEPSTAPDPRLLGFRPTELPAPPVMDRGLQQAWMLATPATAGAIGAGPELGPPPRLRTWVVGGSGYATTVH